MSETDVKGQRAFTYPFSAGASETTFGPGRGWTFADLVDAQWRKLKDIRIVDLRLRRGRGRLDPEQLPCVFLCHDDRRMLPSFLDHYRALGVDRFICVDDRSSDGSADYLLDQHDVDLWQSGRRYKEVRRGKAWREWLMAHYGHRRWYINVDSDEFLIAPMAGKMGLKDYLKALDSHSIQRVAAPMIDLYPARLKDAVYHGENGQRPWKVAPLFDTSGYETGLVKSGANLKGGVRRRVFKSRDHLMKYPLLYWDRFCSLGGSVHWPRPGRRNFTSEWGVLLHFKIFSDLAQRTEAVIEDGQHMGGAANYVTIRDALQHKEIEDLSYEGSVEYQGPESLRARGFLHSTVDPEGDPS